MSDGFLPLEGVNGSLEGVKLDTRMIIRIGAFSSGSWAVRCSM